MRLLNLFIFLLITKLAFSQLYAPDLTYPRNNETNVSFGSDFRLATVSNAKTYELQFDRVNTFDSKDFYSTERYSYDGELNVFRFGEKYFWRARAINGSDTSKWSDIWSFTVEARIKPVLKNPDPLKTENKLLPSGFITHTKGYVHTHLQIDTTPEFSSNEVLDIKSTRISNLVSVRYDGLKFGEVYYCRIRHFGLTDTSEWSDTAQFITYDNTIISGFPYDGVLYDLSPKLSVLNMGIDSNLVTYEVKFSNSRNHEDPAWFHTVTTNSKVRLPTVPLKFKQYLYWHCRLWTDYDTMRWNTDSVKLPDEPEIVQFEHDGKGPQRIRGRLLEVEGFKYYTRISQLKDGLYVPVWDTLRESYYLSSRLLGFHKYKADFALVYNGDTSDFVTEFYDQITSPRPVAPSNQSHLPTEIEPTWSSENDYKPKCIFQLDTVTSFNSTLLLTDTIAKNATSLTLDDLLFDQTYYWRVCYLDRGFTSSYSHYRTFSTYRVPNPTWPDDNGSTVVSESVYVEYKPGDKGYEFMLSESPDFEKFTLDSGRVGKLFFGTVDVGKEGLVDHNVDYEKTYYWKARAFNSSDTSDWSTARSFRTKAEKPQPDIPLLIRPAHQESLFYRDIDSLVWERQKDVSFRIEISRDRDFNTVDKVFLNELGWVSGDDSRHRVELKSSDVARNNTYYWRVKAYNEEKRSSFSEVRSFTIYPAIAPPNKLSYENGTEFKSVVISWPKVPGAAEYHYRYSRLNGGSGKLIKTTDTFAVITDLDFHYIMVVEIRSKNKYETSQYKEFSFRLQSTSIAEEDQQIRVYPNPVSNVLHLQYSGEIEAARIMDAQGRVVLSYAVLPSSIELSAFEPGLYLLEIRTKTSVLFKQIQKL